MDKHLIERLEKVRINVAESSDGRFAVFTSAEPLFFIERDTLDELQATVSHILTDYARTFLSAEGIEIGIVEEKKPEPQQRFKPISALFPSFGGEAVA